MITNCFTHFLHDESISRVVVASRDGSSNPLTVKYYRGAADGTAAYTLTITYSGANVDTITRTNGG